MACQCPAFGQIRERDATRASNCTVALLLHPPVGHARATLAPRGCDSREGFLFVIVSLPRGDTAKPKLVLASGNKECLLGREPRSLTAVQTFSRSSAEGYRKLREMALLTAKDPPSRVVPMWYHNLFKVVPLK